MHLQLTSFTLLALVKLAKAQEAESSTLATINPAWASQYDLSSVPDIAPRPVGSGTCPNSQCGPDDCENCWETCGNCALPDDIYGCQAGQWALTFDDGPSQYTSQLLDILAAANVKATFQMIGSNVIQFPDVVKRAYDEGHQIASHTWSHPHLMSLSNDQIIAEVKTTEDTLFNITGARPAYIRPPYGEADDRVKAIFKAMGYHTLLWNMDTLDWDISEKNESANLILDSFKAALTNGTDLNAHNDPGFISLQHDIYIDTVEQTPNIASLLSQYNFHFVLAYECANLAPYQNLDPSTIALPDNTISSTPDSASNGDNGTADDSHYDEDNSDSEDTGDNSDSTDDTSASADNSGDDDSSASNEDAGDDADASTDDSEDTGDDSGSSDDASTLTDDSENTGDDTRNDASTDDSDSSDDSSASTDDSENIDNDAGASTDDSEDTGDDSGSSDDASASTDDYEDTGDDSGSINDTSTPTNGSDGAGDNSNTDPNANSVSFEKREFTNFSAETSNTLTYSVPFSTITFIAITSYFILA